MLVYDEAAGMHYQYVNVGDAPANPPVANDPYRNALGSLPIAADNWVAFDLNGRGSNQVGFSLEQLGVMTAEATVAAEERNYRWFPDATTVNGSGTNGWGYDISGIVTPYRAPENPSDPLTQAQLEDLYNAGGILVNVTGEEQSITTIDLDINIIRAGAGGSATFSVSVVTRTDDPDNPGTDLYTQYPSSVVAFEGTGFRTFEYLPRGGPIQVGVGIPISVTLTDLNANQVVDVSGIRFSSTSASWLNPVYPFSSDITSETHVPYWDAAALYNTGDLVSFRLPAIPGVFPVATTVFLSLIHI